MTCGLQFTVGHARIGHSDQARRPVPAPPAPGPVLAPLGSHVPVLAPLRPSLTTVRRAAQVRVTMRIVGGRWSGRTLAAPRGDAVRPTSDRVREALFNILGDVEGADVLDACAGTGAIGLEALSRGAASVVAIERDRHAQRALAANIAALGATGIEVMRADLAAALPALHRQFHLMFSDPPWADVPALGRLLLDAAPRLLAPGGQVVLEHAARLEPLDPPRGLALRETRRYGDTALSFYEAEATQPGATE